VAIAIAFSSYVQSSVKSVNKTVAYSIARRLISLYPDKDEETFYLLSSLVALKEDNYPIKLSTLYKIDKNIFEPKKLLEYFYFK
jgi:hypothetical protein